MKLSLKEWRGLRGLTQAQAADACGVFPSTISQWETDPEKISITNAYKLAALYKCRVDEIDFLKKSTKRRYRKGGS